MLLRSIILLLLIGTTYSNIGAQLSRTSFKVKCELADSSCIDFAKNVKKRLQIISGKDAIYRIDTSVIYFRVNEKYDSSYLSHLVNLDGKLSYGFVKNIYSMAPELSIANSKLKEQARKQKGIERIDTLLKYRVNRFLEEALGSALMCKENHFTSTVALLQHESVSRFFEDVKWYSGLPHEISMLGKNNPFFHPVDHKNNFKVIFPLLKDEDQNAIWSINPSNIEASLIKDKSILRVNLNEDEKNILEFRAYKYSRSKLCLLIGDTVIAYGDPGSSSNNNFEIMIEPDEFWKAGLIDQIIRQRMQYEQFEIFSFRSR